MVKFDNEKMIKLIPFILFIFSFALYSPSLFNSFAYDDLLFIVKNEHIKDLKNIKSIFNPKEYFDYFLEASYRPVATFSYMLLYKLARLNPFFYHFLSVIVHSINVILLYIVLKKILNYKIAIYSTLFFLFFPAYSEAVFCITYNEELFALLFLLLAFYYYLKYEKKSLALSLLFFFFALLSKETALIFPLIIFSYEFTFNYPSKMDNSFNYLRRKIFNCFFYFVPLAIYFILRFILFKGDIQVKSDSNFLIRLLYSPYTFSEFLKILIFPFNLKADYIFTYPKNFFSLKVIRAYGISLLILVFLVKMYKIKKEISFSLVWIIIFLLPVLNIFPLFNPIAERYLYIPSIGFALLIGILITLIDEVKEKRFKYILKSIRYIFLAFLFIIFSFVIINRSKEWKDNETLWNAELNKNPKNYKAYQGVALVYLNKGDLLKAKELFEKSVELKPDITSFNNLGIIYYKLKDLNKAEENLKKAIEIAPHASFNYWNLALFYEELGKIDEEIKILYEVIIQDENFIEAYFKIAELHEKKGERDKVELIYKRLIEKKPFFIPVYANLVNFYIKNNRFKEAQVYLEKLISIDPNNEEAKNALKIIIEKVKQNEGG